MADISKYSNEGLQYIASLRAAMRSKDISYMISELQRCRRPGDKLFYSGNPVEIAKRVEWILEECDRHLTRMIKNELDYVEEAEP